MSKYYFETLKNYCWRTDYLAKQPRKSEVLRNANAEGNAHILPNSNNRALIIENEDHIFLQSYDTLIIDIDKKSGNVKKLWDDYSATTMKHINEFLSPYGLSFGKKSWLDFNGTQIKVNA